MPHTIHVNTATQSLELREGQTVLFAAPVSTSKFGLGEEPNSNKTPRGRHCIAEKIGDGQPLLTIFESRIPVGIWDGRATEKDLILTRILWLDGLEDFNRSTRSRYIYFHGTQDEGHIGRPASHGCIRLRNADMLELFERVEIGCAVIIE